MRYSRELPPKGISLRMPLTAESLCAAVDVCGVLLVISKLLVLLLVLLVIEFHMSKFES